jgi:hydroxymethylbilane synthase
MRTIRVGTRKSKLALAQSNLVIDSLAAQTGDFSFALRHIVTKGDRIQNVALSRVGGKGTLRERDRAGFIGR